MLPKPINSSYNSDDDTGAGMVQERTTVSKDIQSIQGITLSSYARQYQSQELERQVDALFDWAMSPDDDDFLPRVELLMYLIYDSASRKMSYAAYQVSEADKEKNDVEHYILNASIQQDTNKLNHHLEDFVDIIVRRRRVKDLRDCTQWITLNVKKVIQSIQGYYNRQYKDRSERFRIENSNEEVSTNETD